MKDISKLSVIIPVVQRVDNLAELYTGYEAALKSTGVPFECVFVVDGGAYAAIGELQEMIDNGASFSVVRLAKYFGEAITLSAGFERASGSHILVLPAYHQVEPQDIHVLLSEIAHCDMVIARRWPRAGSWFESIRRRCFHLLLRMLSGESFQDLGCNVRLFKRQIAGDVHLYGDQHRFFPILVSRQGFTVQEIDVRQSASDQFRGKYRLREYLHRILDMFTVFFLVRFTKKPLRFFGMVGSIVSAIGGIVVLVTVIQRLFFGIGLADRPALLLGSLLLVLGVQTFALGLIGELIIFTHAGKLKEYTIAEIINERGIKHELKKVDLVSGAGNS